MDARSLVETATGAALATDERNRITSWNQAAERLLGHSGEAARGKTLQQLLRARDVFGNRLCADACPLHEMVRRGEPVQSFHLDFRTAAGEYIRVAVSVIVVLGRGSSYQLVYLLRPLRRGRTLNQMMIHLLEGFERPRPAHPAMAHSPAAANGLTPRETEVLRLLAEGQSTRTISHSLNISVHTVRNHTQHILRKLRVQSKLEAVSVAIRQGLV